ncbi:MAG TPA: VWA domain-containing protein [Bryobacteraceae bacterium]|nr:VWA domain-containing protein [Bryobacteraceae bacterium]
MTLLLGTMCLPVIVAILGITVDLSVMYAIKTRLQMACDGAAVAALRSLNLGQTISSQTTAATTVAQEWFTANFAGNFMGAQNTTAPAITVTQSANTYVTTVSVSATTNSPSYFMKYYRFGATLIGAASTASRRNVVITLVLDRSGSMTNANNTYNGLTPCQVMINAAKQFTGSFQEGRDYIGLVTFAETVWIAQAPTQSFQTALGYSNGSGSGTGILDTITCAGGTNTSSAISTAWNMNYQTALPGALNVILLMTDGQPTAGTFNFVTTNSTGAYPDPTGNPTSAIASTSSCLDSTGKSLKTGGNMVTNTTNWINTDQKTAGTSSYGANHYYIGFGSGSWWPNIYGPVGALYADSTPGFYGADPWFSPGTNYSSLENIDYSTTDAPGCPFSNNGYTPSTTDFAFIPPYDVFGNVPTGYVAMPNSNQTILGASRVPFTQGNMVSAVFNLTDNAANWARTTNPGSATFPGNLIYTIGLGGNGGVNFVLLQRVANDPNACPSCTPPGTGLPAYAANTSQPEGEFVYSSDASQLEEAFSKIASQIIRISK